jgi:hypothetical protein
VVVVAAAAAAAAVVVVVVVVASDRLWVSGVTGCFRICVIDDCCKTNPSSSKIGGDRTLPPLPPAAES